ncbi:hypothetical protein Tco_0805917 [Tanacetum coccineum]
MLNRRAQSRITNCDVLTRKGPIRLKVYREDGTGEVIPNFKASDLHLIELGIDLDKPLGEQNPLERLNDLARKKRKHTDDIHDLFRSTIPQHRLKFQELLHCSSVLRSITPAGTRY